MSRTYIMGFWPIPQNQKNSLGHYSRYLALSLEMLQGANLYFISDNDQIISAVTKKCESIGINLYCKRLGIHDLEKYQYIGTLIQRTKNFGASLSCPPKNFNYDKGLNHYWRDLRKSGEDSFEKVFSIWHSKIDLLSLVSHENRFDSREFAWVDASIARFNGKRFAWNFPKLTMNRPNTVYHYPNLMQKYGHLLKINASFLLGDERAIDTLKTTYNEAFVKCLSEDYPNDEETVLDEVVSRNPRLFHSISPSSSAHSKLTSTKNRQPAATPNILSTSGGLNKQKFLVVGAFRSGTNAMKTCLEGNFEVNVTFNEWFWKHGLPPSGIQSPIPPEVPIIIMSKSPVNFQISLYPFWLHRRVSLHSGENISEFIRSEFLVYDNTRGDFVTPTYWYRCPTDYWNQFYFAWINWKEVRSQCLFVRYEDFENSPDKIMTEISCKFNLSRITTSPICLPTQRVGPHVPTERDEARYIMTNDDKAWIKNHINASIAHALRYTT